MKYFLFVFCLNNKTRPIPIYIQQDATLHSSFISVNCCTCFGWYLHPSSGAHTTLSTASGTCQTVMDRTKLLIKCIWGIKTAHGVNCCTCFGWYLHPSSGAHTTVSAASGTCQTVMDRTKLLIKCIWAYKNRPWRFLYAHIHFIGNLVLSITV
jgi:hypothetical protein